MECRDPAGGTRREPWGSWLGQRRCSSCRQKKICARRVAPVRIAHFHLLVESHLILASNDLPASTKIEQVVPDIPSDEPFGEMRRSEQVEHLVLREAWLDIAQVIQVDEGAARLRRGLRIR